MLATLTALAPALIKAFLTGFLVPLAKGAIESWISSRDEQALGAAQAQAAGLDAAAAAAAKAAGVRAVAAALHADDPTETAFDPDFVRKD